jgi:flavoprotein
MNAGETQGYILTFRCVNCGKHEVFANYPSKDMVSEDQIRARIYQVSCTSCGWTGDACGLSAIHISRTTELRARIVGLAN